MLAEVAKAWLYLRTRFSTSSYSTSSTLVKLERKKSMLLVVSMDTVHVCTCYAYYARKLHTIYYYVCIGLFEVTSFAY